MHYIIPAHSATPLEELLPRFKRYEVMTQHERIDTALRHTGLTRLTAQVKDANNDPVTGLLNVWGKPAHGIDAWTDTLNIWITYQYAFAGSSAEGRGYANFYHLKTVFAEWTDMVARDGLIVPSEEDNPIGDWCNSFYDHSKESTNSFSIVYGFKVPKGFVRQLRVWFKRRGPGTGSHEWEVSYLTGPLSKKYAHLIGWSI